MIHMIQWPMRYMFLYLRLQPCDIYLNVFFSIFHWLHYLLRSRFKTKLALKTTCTGTLWWGASAHSPPKAWVRPCPWNIGSGLKSLPTVPAAVACFDDWMLRLFLKPAILLRIKPSVHWPATPPEQASRLGSSHPQCYPTHPPVCQTPGR